MKRLTIKHILANTASTLVFAAIMTGCSKPVQQPLTIEPSISVLSPDVNNNISLNSTIVIPGDYMTSRSAVTIEPVLILDNEVTERYQTINLTGKIYDKKEQRRMALYGYIPPEDERTIKISDTHRKMALPLSDNIHLNDDFNSGRIEAYVTTNGCGECYGADTVVLAYLSNLSNLIDADHLLIQWIDTILPPTVKTFSGEGQARLQFEVDKYEILTNLANNAAEMDSMLTALTPVLKDPLSTLNSMSIKGSASAEGGYEHNVKLAQDRANAAKDWLDQQLKLTPQQMRLIKIGSEPEGWEPVIASMHAAGDPDSALVKEIVMKYPDLKTGQAEKLIRKLACWPRIAEHHLAKDRRVIYKYDWTIKSFDTDEEILSMYETRPDAFSEAELLRVAKLKEGNPDELIEVYETLLKYHPESQIGVNNLAVLYHDYGRANDAVKLLKSQSILTPNMITTLAVCSAEAGDIEGAMHLLSDLDNDNAIYNLGVLLASQHRMSDAYINLANAADLNTAIAALGIGENKEAWTILSHLEDNSSKADYIRAIAQARLGNFKQSLDYLERACNDETLRERAAEEADFMPLHNMPQFEIIINK